MERTVLAALDIYLSTASAAEMVVYATLGVIAVGGLPWGIGHALDHALAARRASQGIR
jgi:hypothetical protein